MFRKKNKSVLLVSSMHDSIETDNENNKPAIVCYYNSTKSGVDVLDMKCANYAANRRTRRWPVAVFYTILNIASVNSFILFMCFKENPIITRLKFVNELAMALITPYLENRIKTPNLRRVIRDEILKIISKNSEMDNEPNATIPSDRLDGNRKTCHICPAKKERKTAYKCIKCSKPICMECSRKVCLQCAKDY